jgi:hypothetical protein
MKETITATIIMGWFIAAMFFAAPDKFGEVFKRFDDARFTMQCD